MPVFCLKKAVNVSNYLSTLPYKIVMTHVLLPGCTRHTAEKISNQYSFIYAIFGISYHYYHYFTDKLYTDG